MLTSGVVILTKPSHTHSVLDALQTFENVTTYGVHKGFNIIAVLEGTTAKYLEELTKKIQQLQGVVLVNPSYINFEEVDV